MDYKNMFRTIALVVLLTLAGCGTPPTQTPKEVRLTEKEGGCGSGVGLNAGDTLELVVGGNPTTGYTWEVGFEVPAVIKTTGEPKYEPDSNAIGAGGTYTFRFLAVSEGQATLVLVYHRPFEKDAPALKACEVTVNVE